MGKEEKKGKLKIRKDYVPKQKKKPSILTQVCPRCNQAIPVTQMAAHVKIELLDPKWRESRAKALEKQNKYSSNIDNNSVSSNLQRLAAKRSDIFGGEETAAAPHAQPSEDTF